MIYIGTGWGCYTIDTSGCESTTSILLLLFNPYDGLQTVHNFTLLTCTKISANKEELLLTVFCPQKPPNGKRYKEKDKLRAKPDKIKSKREARKSPDSSPTKSKPSQNQKCIKKALTKSKCHELCTVAFSQKRKSELLDDKQNLGSAYGFKLSLFISMVLIRAYLGLESSLLAVGDKNKQFFGHDKEDPHAHIRYFDKITSTLKFPNVPNTSIKLMLFPFSLEGAARIWLEKEPPRSIFTWDDLVSKFISQFFPSSKTTRLRNEITNFQQWFDESFSEVWDKFKDLLRACPHHDFSKLHQLDTFYNALNSKDQDSLNSGAGATDGNVYRDNIQEFVSQASAVNYNQGNTSYRPQMMSNQIRPPGFPSVPNNQNVQRNNQNRFILNQNRGNNFNQGPVYQPPVFQQLAYQAPAYQAPAPQTQGVSKEDFKLVMKDVGRMEGRGIQGGGEVDCLVNKGDRGGRMGAFGDVVVKVVVRSWCLRSEMHLFCKVIDNDPDGVMSV
nr:reverse transcriptase domain-containing protein [Tanacetum cinerariifolium]